MKLISAVIKDQTDEGGDGDDDSSDDAYSDKWVHTRRGAVTVISAQTGGTSI